jgi:AcrR family transcriptional regulator
LLPALEELLNEEDGTVNVNSHLHFGRLEYAQVQSERMAHSTPADIHAPKQARSQQSMRRLIDAARQILNEDGLEAATIPRIAERAGLSVGSIYRRFPDKDALLREICIQYFLDKHEFLSHLAEQIPADAALADIIQGMAQGMMRSFMQDAGLMRATFFYSREQAEPKMRQKIERAGRRTFELTVGILLSRRNQIGHSDPEMAAQLSITMMLSTIREMVLFHCPKMSAADSGRVASELALAVSRYLEVKTKT